MKLTRKQWMMLVVLVLGAFVTVLNQTLVTPALPSIMTEMNVDQSTAQWLTTGFTLVNAIMIPITAFLQDRFSTRKLFVFSMSLFAVGTLLAAVGLNFPVLLGGRLVQAAGAENHFAIPGAARPRRADVNGIARTRRPARCK